MDALSTLAEKYKTDKGLWHHGYTPIYHDYFERLRHSKITLLEIGIGGYNDPHKGGESLKMWGEYFANGKIIGIDIHDKYGLTKGNVSTYKYNATSDEDMHQLLWINGGIDIVIDDGSHINTDIIEAFEIIFPHIADGGIYVVEDTETAYFEEHGYKGCSDTTNHTADTSMNYFKSMCHNINHDALNIFGIKSIHFYKGLIFIFKK